MKTDHCQQRRKLKHKKKKEKKCMMRVQLEGVNTISNILARKRASEEAAKKQEELGSLSYSEEEDSSDSDNDDDDDDDESEEVSENDDDDELEKVHDSTLVSFGVIEMKGTDVTVHVPPCELTKRYKTFYYQVCPIGGYAPLYILTEMKKNKFKIGSTEKVHLRISWEIRGDALK
eukprot:TRINITY_DN11864_c0_g2_i10.p2 TRINITY_DN11864_c0_g2~~TRINITY_DN11864_c0_g2_i10.p2  ORF type:complete len:175 (-),score=47.37 TRINITY_DN11864_c0_g2_i10:165-689(-)